MSEWQLWIHPLTELLQQDSLRMLWMALGFMAMGAVVEYILLGLWRGWKLRRRFRKGAEAERRAIRFLQQRGYRIIDSQLQKRFSVEVNGEKQMMTVRADYLVKKHGRLYIVEVKSGKQGDVALTHVRRQLMEYNLVYQPDGIILLDMAHRHLQEIRFHYPHHRFRKRAAHLLAGALLGIMIAWAVVNWEIQI